MAEKCYKVVRKLKDGRLVSEFANGSNYPQLEYQYGRTTRSTDGCGIFCHRELEPAKESANYIGNEYASIEIHVAYAVGEEIPYWGSMSELVNYPAIKFGRKVSTIR